MNYHDITTDDMKNGSGLRTVLWVAGCTHHCKGCQNPVTWDVNGGIPFTDEAKEELYAKLTPDYISGITFSGGDPLHPANEKEVVGLARDIRSRFPDKTIWLYTGFTWDEIYGHEILKYLDVLVDGEYQEEIRDVTLHWRGSKNQNVIDVKKSLAQGRVILYGDC